MKVLKSSLLLLSVLCTVLSVQSCKDACEDVVCQNDGTCVDGTCECPEGTSGTLCEFKLAGTYNVSNGCTSSDYSSEIVGITDLVITNFLGASMDLTATRDGNNITIPSQSVLTGTIIGSGVITGNDIDFSYALEVLAVSIDCTSTYRK